ncbi:RND transporter [Steroidobacter denitrificans]|uniref:RND transporter n=1 Tax=Steroidobacter denitrificans TaxID=465721 RepID=A0A127FEJ6_STEDE|nr:efflux RND transporter periplasmic adaptor subunit [Steroidobacter denitrificans]AMN48390.1 RND transporter [Steroidobacter denitrificans]
MDTQSTTSADVVRTLSGTRPWRAAGWRRWVWWAAAALVLILVAYLILGRGGADAPRYVTQEVTRGDLTVTVTATGNLEPRNQVDIGSELSGMVRVVNVDVNDQVSAGQLLAVLDTSRLEAQALQAESTLKSAQARVLQSQAALKKARADLARMQHVRELSGGKLPSQQDMDVAEAAVSQAEGELAAAQATVEQARANLDVVRTDLGKSEIRSPIDGVVLVRSIEPGQTVAASLQAPVLFTLAEDLKKMELHVAVDEADVGAVEKGQKASFTVDAFPNRTFAAGITQVHYASSNTKSSSSGSTGGASATSTGVVTYETVLEVDNPEQLLRPGMTATAEIVTTQVQDALLVPNAALRFTPPSQAPAAPAASQRGGALSALMPRMPRRPGSGGQRGVQRGSGVVWILEKGAPVRVAVRSGASDGRMTQILPTAVRDPEAAAAPDTEATAMTPQRRLEPGMQVIVDIDTAAS